MLLGMDHPLEYDQRARRHALKENGLSLPRSYQLPVAPQLMGLMKPFMSLAGVGTGVSLFRSWADHRRCWDLMTAVSLSCPEDTVCFSPSWPLALKVSRPLFCDSAWGLGKGCEIDFPFVAEYPLVICSYIHVIGSVVSCCIKLLSAAQRNFFERFESCTPYSPERLLIPWLATPRHLADILTSCVLFAMASDPLVSFLASHCGRYAGGLFWRVPGELTYLRLLPRVWVTRALSLQPSHASCLTLA